MHNLSKQAGSRCHLPADGLAYAPPLDQCEPAALLTRFVEGAFACRLHSAPVFGGGSATITATLAGVSRSVTVSVSAL
jgi:hypothetical protein